MENLSFSYGRPIYSEEMPIEFDIEYLEILERQKAWEQEKTRVFEQSQREIRTRNDAIVELENFQREAMVRKITAAVVKKLESCSNNYTPTEKTVKYDDYDEDYVLIQSTQLALPKCEKIVDVDVTSFTPSDDIESIGDNFKVNLVNGEDTENIDFIFGENHLSRVNLVNDENDTEFGVVKINDQNQDHNAKIGVRIFDKNGSLSDLVQRQHDYKQIGDNRSQNLIYNICLK